MNFGGNRKPYPSYRLVEADWLQSIPDHWDLIPLKRTIVSCKNGIWGSDPTGFDDTPCVRVGDLDRVQFRVNMDHPTMRSIEKTTLAGRIIRRGDLLLEKSGGGERQLVGAVALYDHDTQAVCSNFMARMLVQVGFEPNFLCYLHSAIYSSRINLKSVKQSTGIQNLDDSSYLSEVVPMPPTDEQAAIAEFLDRETSKLDALIQKKQRLIELLNEKRAALISHAVTKGLDPDVSMREVGVEWLGKVPVNWNVTRLKFETSHIVDCLHSTPEYKSDGEYPAIRTADVTPGKINIETARRVNTHQYREQIKRLRPVPGDILYSREGERYGIAAPVPETVNLCMSQRMMHFRAKQGINGHYLMWALNSSFVYAQARVDTTGATSPHVNVDTIRNFTLLVPSPAEQDQIAHFLDSEHWEIDASVQIISEAVALLTEYRAALISAAVTGQIDVRNEV